MSESIEPIGGTYCYAKFKNGAWTIFARHSKFRCGNNVITKHDCAVGELVDLVALKLILTSDSAKKRVAMWDQHITDQSTEKKGRK